MRFIRNFYSFALWEEQKTVLGKLSLCQLVPGYKDILARCSPCNTVTEQIRPSNGYYLYKKQYRELTSFSVQLSCNALHDTHAMRTRPQHQQLHHRCSRPVRPPAPARQPTARSRCKGKAAFQPNSLAEHWQPCTSGPVPGDRVGLGRVGQSTGNPAFPQTRTRACLYARIITQAQYSSAATCIATRTAITVPRLGTSVLPGRCAGWARTPGCDNTSAASAACGPQQC